MGIGTGRKTSRLHPTFSCINTASLLSSYQALCHASLFLLHIACRCLKFPESALTLHDGVFRSNTALNIHNTKAMGVLPVYTRRSPRGMPMIGGGAHSTQLFESAWACSSLESSPRVIPWLLAQGVSEHSEFVHHPWPDFFIDVLEDRLFRLASVSLSEVRSSNRLASVTAPECRSIPV